MYPLIAGDSGDPKLLDPCPACVRLFPAWDLIRCQEVWCFSVFENEWWWVNLQSCLEQSSRQSHRGEAYLRAPMGTSKVVSYSIWKRTFYMLFHHSTFFHFMRYISVVEHLTSPYPDQSSSNLPSVNHHGLVMVLPAPSCPLGEHARLHHVTRSSGRTPSRCADAPMRRCGCFKIWNGH